MKYLIVSKNNPWSRKLFFNLKNKKSKFDFFYGKNLKERLSSYKEGELKYIFFFHWSDYIPEDIFTKYNCISFHTSNLPQGRGGSPIQNQILEKINKTYVNAIKTSKELDKGGIYLRRQITLQGSLGDIWHTIADETYDMIIKIIENDTQSMPQYLFGTETPTTYKRIKDNNLPLEQINDLQKVYDYIRMRDAQDYSPSSITINNFILEFSRAKFDGDEILADIKIRKK